MTAKCGKECFTEKSGATAKARAMQCAGKKGQDVYYCLVCTAWHTTKLYNKKFRDIAPRHKLPRKERAEMDKDASTLFCCTLNCDKDATWDVWSQPFHYEDNTQSCDAHLVESIQGATGQKHRCENLATGQRMDIEIHAVADDKTGVG